MFSKANAKLIELQKNPAMQDWLQDRRKVYSFDLISGHSCPFAEACLAKVKVINGRRKVIDGPKMKFRCFSASQEALLTNVYNKRLTNFNMLKGKTLEQMVHMISGAMPHNLGIGRIHVAGDFFNPIYFRAWIEIALMFPDRLFYGYTKSLSYWLKNLGNIPENLVLTASYGGKQDSLIEQLNLRSAVVVYSYEQAEQLGLEVDHDDSHAANPLTHNENFALMIHGIQPAGSEAGAARQKLKEQGRKFSYSR